MTDSNLPESCASCAALLAALGNLVVIFDRRLGNATGSAAYREAVALLRQAESAQ